MYLKKILPFLALVLLLTSCSKNSDDGDDSSQGGDSGSATFYHNDPFPCNTISIKITDSNGIESTGQLSGASVVSGTPSCDVPDTFTFLNLAYGVYQFEYTCGGTTSSGQFGVNSECFVILMIN